MVTRLGVRKVKNPMFGIRLGRQAVICGQLQMIVVSIIVAPEATM